MKVKASTDLKKAGLEHAINLGALAVEPGPRGALFLRYVGEIEVEEG